MGARFRSMKPVRRPRVAVVATEADLAEAAEAVAEAVVAAVVVEAAAEAVVAAEAVAVMAATGTAEIAGASNGDSPALVPHQHLRLLRGTSPVSRFGDEFDFHLHIARQSRYLHGRAGRWRLAKILAIDRVHRGEIVHI